MPPLEAWEKVYISLGSKDNPGEIDNHMAMQTCEECHGGNPAEQDDMEAAHEGLIEDPASMEHNACGKCHNNIANTFKNSMHAQLWGEKTTIMTRTGVDTWAEVPQGLREGHQGECARCHASCGDCHISRPDDVGQGFIKNHEFRKKPHQKNQCMACHGSRVAFDYMGDSEAGRDADVHFTKGWDCMKCHDDKHMHADASGQAHRYGDNPKATRCVDCHDIPNANEYHSTHWGDLQCQVCHSQPYNNCTECHVGGAFKTDPEYQENSPALDFRIGVNHLENRRFEFAVVRHAPVHPTSYDEWGESGLLTHYDDFPSWKYATPHNIRRWTPQTEVVGARGCAASCHIGAPMGNPENAKYYLFEEYVQENWPEELEANSAVIVNEELPDGWDWIPEELQ